MKQPSINQKDIHQLFDDFNQLNVLIIGDVMIDAYYFGKVDRISCLLYTSDAADE